MESKYKDIRYYNDEDFSRVFPKMLEEDTFKKLLYYTFDGFAETSMEEVVNSIKTVDDFQLKFIIRLIIKLEKDSVDNFSASGLSDFSTGNRHLFISNHRNIIMDPSFINLALYRGQSKSFSSTAIAIGNNLLSNPFIKHMARANKCFIVERDANVQRMIESSKRLSSYIRYLIKDDINSVWIAHREGRTKDGDDRAQAGLIKMLQMSGEGSFSEKMSELKIVPIVISYEFDPFAEDKMKAIVIAQKGEKYEKKPYDDLTSMYMESIGYKGNVHIHFGEEFSKRFFETLDKKIPLNKKIRKFTTALDNFTHQNYMLWPSNFIAADILNDNEQFADFYDFNDKKNLLERQKFSLDRLKTNDEDYKNAFLKLYANPVKNKLSHNEKYEFNF